MRLEDLKKEELLEIIKVEMYRNLSFNSCVKEYLTHLQHEREMNLIEESEAHLSKAIEIRNEIRKIIDENRGRDETLLPPEVSAEINSLRLQMEEEIRKIEKADRKFAEEFSKNE